MHARQQFWIVVCTVLNKDICSFSKRNPLDMLCCVLTQHLCTPQPISKKKSTINMNVLEDWTRTHTQANITWGLLDNIPEKLWRSPCTILMYRGGSAANGRWNTLGRGTWAAKWNLSSLFRHTTFPLAVLGSSTNLFLRSDRPAGRIWQTSTGSLIPL